MHVAPISESEGCGLVARATIAPGEVVLRVPLSCCMHVEAVPTPKSVLAPLAAAEADLLTALPDDEVLALLLMAERRAGPRSFWWPYLRWVAGWMMGGGCWEGCWMNPPSEPPGINDLNTSIAGYSHVCMCL